MLISLNIVLLLSLFRSCVSSIDGYRVGFEYIDVYAYTTQAQNDGGYDDAYLSIECRGEETGFIFKSYPSKTLKSIEFDIDEDQVDLDSSDYNEKLLFGLIFDENIVIDYDDDTEYVECKIEVKRSRLIFSDPVIASTEWINLNRYTDYNECKVEDGSPQGFGVANKPKRRSIIAPVIDSDYDVTQDLADDIDQNGEESAFRKYPGLEVFVINAHIPLICTLN